MPRLMGCTHSLADPATRFRFLQYVPLLVEAGWQVSHRPNVPSRTWKPAAPFRWMRSIQRKSAVALRKLSRLRDLRDAARYDAIFINRDLLSGELWWEQQFFRKNPRVVFDFDDAIYLGEERSRHIEWICRNAAWVTAGNESLAAFARQFSDRVTVLPTVVDVSQYACHPHDVKDRPVRVGWMGSELSIQETLFPHLGMLARLQQRLPFEFVIISGSGPAVPETGLRFQFIPWSPDVEINVARQIDIGLMPLVDNEYQRGKCGLKLLQYMAAGIPAVATPLGVNRQIIRHGETGLLSTTDEEWFQSLSALIENAQMRCRIGLAGRAFCDEHYSLRRWFPEFLRICTMVSHPKC
ncbi:MAG: glycosyltransferase family 4 protein [Planctomycetes bacterium]|nr:glycosyltransferase family 4 protein [Planctomycetota bacterium]